MRKLATMGVALVIAAALVAPMQAEAKLTTAEPSVSLPYVEDVNPYGGGYVATVSCAGRGSAILKVTCKGKPVKVRKVAKRTWTVKMKQGRCYKLSVRSGSACKSIGYRIY